MPTSPASTEGQGSSTRPYLIRALHDWCTDNGFTPYVAVFVDETVQVPREYVKNHEIVLNVGFDATSSLRLGNEFIEFKARFGGVARDIVVPVDHVIAIYARENGQGMAFPAPSADAAANRVGPASGPGPLTSPGGLRLASTPEDNNGLPDDNDPPPTSPAPDHNGGGAARPSLKRIK
jgi:stringent starvation protein B